MEYWLIAYKMFKLGFLPNNGGWLNQSNKFIKIMAFIDSELTRNQDEMVDKYGRK